MAVNFEALEAMVKKAARDANNKFPSFHDVRDTEQAIWLFLFEKRNTVENMVRDAEQHEWITPVYDLALKVAYSFLKEQDASWYGYSEEDAFYYSKELIKDILEVVFLHEEWQSFATVLDRMPKGKSDPATAGNNLASYVDVSNALKFLSEKQYNAVVWRYKYQLTQEGVGNEMGVTREAARQLLDNAVSALQRALGRRDLGELRDDSETDLRPYGVADALAQSERNYNG
jgi:DNA-directed RNA polymerase specialized sigma24 family protein